MLSCRCLCLNLPRACVRPVCHTPCSPSIAPRVSLAATATRPSTAACPVSAFRSRTKSPSTTSYVSRSRSRCSRRRQRRVITLPAAESSPCPPFLASSSLANAQCRVIVPYFRRTLTRSRPAPFAASSSATNAATRNPSSRWSTVAGCAAASTSTPAVRASLPRTRS